MNTHALECNNPACMKNCVRGKGMIPKKSSEGLCVFVAKSFGVRAMLVRLRNIVCRERLESMESVLTRWATMNKTVGLGDLLLYAESYLYDPMTDTVPFFLKEDFERKPMWGHADLYHLSCVICYFESGYILPYSEWKAAFDML